MKKTPRAIRNANPGNIRRSIVVYRGEVESDDNQFKKFASVDWGFRAIFVLLHTYVKRYRLQTIPEMIARYAPPQENATDKYSAFVCRVSGIASDAVVDTMCREQMVLIVTAIAQMECGTAPDMKDVEAGWTLFVKYKP